MKKSIQDIFIWENYGNINVYHLNTYDDYLKVYNSIKGVLVDHGYVPKLDDGRRNLRLNRLHKMIKDIDNHLNKFPNNIRSIFSSLKVLLMEIEPCDPFGRNTELSKISSLDKI